ncbi:hypothetical protein COCOBI_04-5900 [Coccomyxa sp. Obi]|nr:hypothetical protein COCOBI_04-5900 [Coccomyxa sp. Obi]
MTEGRTVLNICIFILVVFAATGVGGGRVATIVDKQHEDLPFSYFFFIADDSPGNSTVLFFSDTKAHCIRKLAKDGALQDFAGACGHAGYTNAKGLSARFNSPKGLCMSPNGVLAVVDTNNACIRQITPEGDVTTLAGECGNPGDVDGEMHSALFSNGIEDIACLPNCTFLVTDPSSRSVRAIVPDDTCTAQPEPPAAGSKHGMGAGAAAACGAGAALTACALVWLLSIAGRKWVRKQMAAKRAAVCTNQGCDVIGAEQPSGRVAAATSWGGLWHKAKYGAPKVAYPSHMLGADDSAYGSNLRSGQSNQDPSSSREPNLLDFGEESESVLSADAAEAGEPQQREAGGAEGGLQGGSKGAIARDPFDSLQALS